MCDKDIEEGAQAPDNMEHSSEVAPEQSCSIPGSNAPSTSEQKEAERQQRAFNAVDAIYSLRRNFIVIGLTGRTGSGCSTVADLLSGEAGFSHLNPPIPSASNDGITDEGRKYRILYNYLNIVWQKGRFEFKTIQASAIIFFYVLAAGRLFFEEAFMKDFTHQENPNDPKSTSRDASLATFDKTAYDSFKDRLWKKTGEEFDSLSQEAKAIHDLYTGETCEASAESGKYDESQLESFLTDRLPKFYTKVCSVIQDLLNRKMSKEMQDWGNTVRRYGSVCPDARGNISAPSALAETINWFIKKLREIKEVKRDDNKALFIVIDALRNPYEILYFRERHSAFYLMSINTSEEERLKNLHQANYRKGEIDTLDSEEHPKKNKNIADSFYNQDVQRCIEMSDIHIVHKNKPTELNTELKKQLVHYLALMLHPGLVPPTAEERLMQIANTAKLNSGCISRQVGAVVTDKNFSVKSIGWNIAPEGQTPCSLRDFNDLCQACDRNAYSEYELNDERFRKHIRLNQPRYMQAKAIMESNGYSTHLPYCFKDLYSCFENKKNQVHTRSLHAEENAFLQLAKYGSEGIEGGCLFTTASPCELCAKKAYQLGIKKIYYVDIYPGISFNHILRVGLPSCRPELHLFQGAIGHAYQRLYSPLLPLKDEIECLTNVHFTRKEDTAPNTSTNASKDTDSGTLENKEEVSQHS